jgi:hypothetical protein
MSMNSTSIIDQSHLVACNMNSNGSSVSTNSIAAAISVTANASACLAMMFRCTCSLFATKSVCIADESVSGDSVPFVFVRSMRKLNTPVSMKQRPKHLIYTIQTVLPSRSTFLNECMPCSMVLCDMIVTFIPYDERVCLHLSTSLLVMTYQ